MTLPRARLARTALPILVGLLALATASRPADAQPTATQKIVDFAFDPPTITVATGTAVAWSNLGPTDHTVAAADLSWSSDIMVAGDVYSRAFDAPGSYPIICSLHPEMTGTVVVQ